MFTVINGLEVELLGRERGYSEHSANILRYRHRIPDSPKIVVMSYSEAYGSRIELLFYESESVHFPYRVRAYVPSKIPEAYRSVALRLIATYRKVFS